MDNFTFEVLTNARDQCTIQVSFKSDKEYTLTEPSNIYFIENFRIQDGQANYVACHHESYVEADKFDVVKFIKRGGVFFLNTRIASLDAGKRIKALEDKLSPKILRTL